MIFSDEQDQDLKSLSSNAEFEEPVPKPENIKLPVEEVQIRKPEPPKKDQASWLKKYLHPDKPSKEEPDIPPLVNPPAGKDWTPIDVSHGTFRNSELYGPRKTLEYKLGKELRGVLPKLKERQAVAGMIFSKRKNGLSRQEIKKGLKGLKEQGVLKPYQVKKLRHKFGAF